MGHFNALFITLKEVIAIVFIECAKPLHNLILARKINLFERFLHLRLQLDILNINFLNSHILRVNQELKILAFLLELAQSLLPFKLTRISFFFDLDDLMMKLIILLCELLIQLLKRN